MLDVKQLTGHELYIIREGLHKIGCWSNPLFSGCYNRLKDDIDNEWTERCFKL